MRRGHRVLAVALATAICCTFGTAVATVAVRQGPLARALAGSAPPNATNGAGAEGLRGLAALASVKAAPTDRLLALATFGRSAGAGAGAGATDALGNLGLESLLFERLPFALVAGTKAELESAVRKGVATDVWPDERLTTFSAESTAAIRADLLRAGGLTGKGVGVAVVDTGIDATHPDLADHVTHNLKLIGPEHLDILGDKQQANSPFQTIVIPMDQLPYNNSDTTSGHGTHVAGIVAADAHTGPAQIGVAPDAHLIGYGAGDALSVFTVLAAFDHILANAQAWDIEVVNNSWGSSGRLFDPAHPINLATKALHDAGLVVVFAAGNEGEEGTINPYSVAPWVISVGSATNAKAPSSFSSAGYQHDNSRPDPVPADRHLRFDGDRIGLYHPDVSAPGTDIVSSGTITGIGVLAPTLPGGTTTLSGTSMAAPHVAGLAAVLLQARPGLSPAQVRRALEVTAVPLTGDPRFWQSGYGFVDGQAAVELVTRADFSDSLLDQLQADDDRRVLRARTYAVDASDVWSFKSPLLSVAGSDTRTFEFAVSPSTSALRAVVSYPSLGLVGLNPFDWRITLVDAAGATVATSTTRSGSAGVSSLSVDLTEAGRPAPAFGTWKAVLSGELALSDTDALIGNIVTLAVSQLAAQAVAAGGRAAADEPGFVPEGAQPLYFQAGTAAGVAGLPALPALPALDGSGCLVSLGAPRATMGGAQHGTGCFAGLVGFAVTHAADTPAEFTSSAALEHPLAVGGPSSLTLWLADAAAPVWTAAGASRISYALDAVDGAGQATTVASGDLERVIDGPDEVGPTPARAEYGFTVTPTTLAAGSTLRLRLRFSGAYTSTMQLYFGGRYADAGLMLGTGRFA